jgi:pantetheine-phosphate adenylyltransferase
LTIAVYVGSFDPVTNGHLDIANRAAALFDQLVVGVYDVPQKTLLFNTEERMDLMRKAVSHLPNVKVERYTGLTVEFARKMNAQVVVRGLRMSSDFEREFEMALMNKKLAADIELVCLMSSLDYQFLSSSLLKEACQLGGDITSLVPEHVATALANKYGLTDK